MAAAKEKSSSRWSAWLAPILFLLAAVVAAPSAPASMTRALETRAWEKTSAPLDSRLDESLQLLNLHQQNEAAGYDNALGSPLAAESETTLQQLQGAANRAATNVGPGSGPVYGTTVHTAFQGEVDAFGNANLATEQSYLNGNLVPRGTPGSVRLDVVEGPLNNPTAIYDLKTGSATLTPARIQQIQSHLPGGSSVPVTEVRP
jgi:hypothetical protein